MERIGSTTACRHHGRSIIEIRRPFFASIPSSEYNEHYTGDSRGHGLIREYHWRILIQLGFGLIVVAVHMVPNGNLDRGFIRAPAFLTEESGTASSWWVSPLS